MRHLLGFKNGIKDQKRDDQVGKVFIHHLAKKQACQGGAEWQTQNKWGEKIPLNMGSQIENPRRVGYQLHQGMDRDDNLQGQEKGHDGE